MVILRPDEQIRGRSRGKNVLGRRNGMNRSPEVRETARQIWETERNPVWP